MLYRGCDSVVEAVREPIEAVRESIEAVRVQVEIVRVPIEVVQMYRGHENVEDSILSPLGLKERGRREVLYTSIQYCIALKSAILKQ
jgi:hypothetical protein